MTEDMRERFEKLVRSLGLALHFAWEQGRGYVAPDTWKAFAIFKAALSSAGTSGTADYWILEWSFKGKNKWQPVDRPPFRSEMEVLSYRQREGFDYRIVALRGDSLSGKGGL